jgi:glycosyltransferase involved in cell wall biosynthesis
MLKLSIITINLNNANGLRKTIESVICQTFTDFEYIVIDGGSTDGSVEIIEKYATNITFWVSEPDNGIYNAMNKGILQAKGEYCYFLNSGDTLYAETVLEEIFSDDYMEDILAGNLIRQYPDRTMEDKSIAYFCAKEGKQLSLFNLMAGTIPHQSAFIRRKLFDQYGLYDENYRIVSDWRFFVQTIVLHGATVKYIDLFVADFDMEGVSNMQMDVLLKEKRQALEELIPPAILADYDHFAKINHDFHRMFKNKTSYRIGRFLNKLITLWDMLTGKQITISNYSNE